MADDYFETCKNDKAIVLKNENNIIYVTKFSVIITNNINKARLKNYNDILELIISKILSHDNTTLDSVRYEARTEDFIKRIEEVELLYNDIRVDTLMKEQYNRFRGKNNYIQKERTEEHYSCEYRSNYFNEDEICYNKIINFSTAEYYNENIGRVMIDICTNYFNFENNTVSKSNVIDTVNKLKEKQFKILLSSFKQEYLEKLF